MQVAINTSASTNVWTYPLLQNKDWVLLNKYDSRSAGGEIPSLYGTRGIITAFKRVKLSRYRHADVTRGVSSYLFLTSAQDVSGQRHAPAALYPQGMDPCTHWIGGWVDLRVCMGPEATRKVLCLCRGLNPDRPVCSQSGPSAEGPCYKSQPTDRLSWFRFITVFLSPCKQMPE
jgi:hypothetical protein